MVTARWIKPRVETENIKRKKSNYATLKKNAIKPQRVIAREEEKNKITPKQKENNKQNCTIKSLSINN